MFSASIIAWKRALGSGNIFVTHDEMFNDINSVLVVGQALSVTAGCSLGRFRCANIYQQLFQRKLRPLFD